MSSMPLKIVIPSHKRHDRVLSKKLVVDPIICVAKSQEDIYREYNPDCEIVTHPDSVVGLIPKRNWMAKYFNELFMLDDDVNQFRRLYIEKEEKAAIKDKVVITKLINELYELACMLDVHVFGFTNKTTPVMYPEEKYFSLTNAITGCAYGVRYNTNVWWNEYLKLKEDFWISCYMKYKERKILTDQRYNFTQKDTFCNSGGLASIRNQAEERRNILELKKYFGNAVSLKKEHFNGRDKIIDKVKYNISVKFDF